MIITHEQVWRAIDALAADNATSPSGLARRSGLDATSFNRSKRINAHGRERWPSMESIAKILTATGEPLEVFTRRITGNAEPPSEGAATTLAVAQQRNRLSRPTPEIHAGR
jgi:phage repressor protein C with HTH and peptisase S24 domain